MRTRHDLSKLNLIRLFIIKTKFIICFVYNRQTFFASPHISLNITKIDEFSIRFRFVFFFFVYSFLLRLIVMFIIASFFWLKLIICSYPRFRKNKTKNIILIVALTTNFDKIFKFFGFQILNV